MMIPLRLMWGLLSGSLHAILLLLLVLLTRALFQKLHIPKRFAMVLWIVWFVALIMPFRYTFFVSWADTWMELSSNAMLNVGEDGTSTMLIAGADGPTSIWSKPRMAGSGNPISSDPGDHNDFNAQNDTNMNEVEAVDIWVNPLTLELLFNDRTTSINPQWLIRLLNHSAVIFGIWIIGVLILLTYALYRGIRFHRLLATSTPVDSINGARYSDRIDTPLVFGYFPPRIYLPYELSENVLPYAVEHEKTHIRFLHPWVKLAAYIITCFHWFNPCVWLAYRLMCTDMEMACDEETIRFFDQSSRKKYADALLAMALGEGVHPRRFIASPLSFEEGDIKKRLKNLADWKRAKAVLLILASILTIAITMLLFTRLSSGREALPAIATRLDTVLDAEKIITVDDEDTTDETTHIYRMENGSDSISEEISRDYTPDEVISVDR